MEDNSIDFPRIFIVVPVYNHLTTVCAFLELIIRQSYSKITVILVDDSSTDCTVDTVRDKFEDKIDIVILQTEGDAWWGGSVYIGIEEVFRRAGNSDCALLMNDDVSFDDQLVEKFVQAHNRFPRAVLGSMTIVNGRVSATGSNMLCWPLALTVRPYVGFEWPNKKIPEVIEVEFQGAHATMYPLSVLRVIGNVAFRELPHYHADGEYSYRAVRSGFPSYVVSSLAIYSDPHSTGLFNSFHTKYSWKDLLPSFIYFKSINNVKHRWYFAKLCCPVIWRNAYFVSHVLKAFVRSIYMLLAGGRSFR